MVADPDETNVRVHLNAFPRLFADPSLMEDRAVVRKGNALHIVVHDNLPPLKLANDANAVFGRFSIGGTAVWLLGIAIGLLLGATVVVFLSFLEIFNEQFRVVAYKFDLPAGYLERVYLVSVLVCGAAVFSFLPRLVSQPDGGAGHSVLRWLVNDGARILDRLSTRLSVGILVGTVKEIHVWNPLAFTEGHRNRFLSLLVKKNVPLNLYLHHDEVSDWAAFARSQDVSWSLAESSGGSGATGSNHFENSLAQWVDGPRSPAAVRLEDLAAASTRLFGGSASVVLGVLFLSSSRCGVAPWADALARNRELRHGLVSLDFAKHLVGQVMSKETSSEAKGLELLRVLFERASKDYGLFQESKFGNSKTISGHVVWSPEHIPSEWSAIAGVLHMKAQGLSRQLHDSSALFCALVQYDAPGLYSGEYRELIERFIEEAHREGNLSGAGVVGDVCCHGLERDFQEYRETPGEDGVRSTREVLNGVSVENLTLLAELFEGAGEFDAALDVFDWLKHVDPVVSHIRMARLLERTGKFEEALEFLLSRYRVEMEAGIELCAGNGGDGLNGGSRMCVNAVRYHLQWAWIIVSGGLTVSGAGISSAKIVLEKVRRVSEHPHCDFLSPMDRWQLWNYLGQVCEWEGNFQEAVTLHERAGGLPGVPLRWKGGSFINASIAVRKKALAQRNAGVGLQSGGWSVVEDLKWALSLVMRGAEIKLGIGDFDEAAVALHNGAHARLCLSLCEESVAVSHLNEAIRLSTAGLAIVGATASNKKIGMLVAENAFGHILLARRKVAVDRAKVVVAQRVEEFREIVSGQVLSDLDMREVIDLYGVLFDRPVNSLEDILAELGSAFA